jgi:beta-glucosidase
LDLVQAIPRFFYDNLKLNFAEIAKNGELKVTVDVTNSGERDGEEVVQLYIRDLVGSLVRPIKELKGFEKIMLKSGETKKVSFTINSKTLQFYTANRKWEVEPGTFNIWVGGDSNASLKETFSVVE